MRRAAPFRRATSPYAAALLVATVMARLTSGQEILPNSSRECAICHIRWVQALDPSTPQKGPMQAVMDRQAGSGDMCLSCHDGSVADSRFKVWATRHHTTDAVPSPAVSIPTDKFPLDAQGRMTCATCHTAHALPGNSDLKTVIFLRQPNVESSLCLACHPQHAQKSDHQHPLGRGESPVPRIILEAGGKTSPDGHAILCQTCHEPHGAQNAWMLVLPPSDLCVACHADKAPEASPPAGAPVHRIGRTFTGFKPPAALLDTKAVFGPNGELGCLSCHRLHDASGAKPLLIRENQNSSLCIECHEDERAVLGSPHDLRISSPETKNARGQTTSQSGPCGACHRIHGWARDVPATDRPHSSGCMECHKPGGPGSRKRPYVEAHPMGVPVPKEMSPPLPLDATSRASSCLTCHDPHSPRPAGAPAEAQAPNLRRETGRTEPVSDFLFLRREGSQLCVLCHDKMTASLQGAHDPAGFTASLRESLGIHSPTGSCRTCHTAHNAQGPHLWARAPADSPNGPISNLCAACHNADHVQAPQGTHHPLTSVAGPRSEPPGTGPMRPVLEVSCTSCHDPHRGPQPAAQLRESPDTLCFDCHKDKEGIKGSAHDPRAREWGKSLDVASQKLCLECHPIHGPRKQGGLWKSLGGEQAPEDLCQACHRLGQPGTAVETPHVGKAILNGPRDLKDLPRADPDQQVRCTSCHDIHQNRQDSKLLRTARHDSVLCLACHAEFGRLLDTPHDLRKSAPATRNVCGELPVESGPCGSCHLVHPTSPGGGTWAQRFPLEHRDGKGLCTGCHSRGERAIPRYVDHPEVALLNRTLPGQPNYMPTFDDHGRSSPTGAISCPTCHQVHTRAFVASTDDGAPSSHRALLRTTHPTLCADCHGIETLWRFLYYHKADRNPHPQRTTNASAADAGIEADQPARSD